MFAFYMENSYGDRECDAQCQHGPPRTPAPTIPTAGQRTQCWPTARASRAHGRADADIGWAPSLAQNQLGSAGRTATTISAWHLWPRAASARRPPRCALSPSWPSRMRMLYLSRWYHSSTIVHRGPPGLGISYCPVPGVEKACPSGKKDSPLPTFLLRPPPPPARAPPAAWVALARSTDGTLNNMPNSMPGTEGQGATTAASLFGVFAKEAANDET
jgi:hypothetical protein